MTGALRSLAKPRIECYTPSVGSAGVSAGVSSAGVPSSGVSSAGAFSSGVTFVSCSSIFMYFSLVAIMPTFYSIVIPIFFAVPSIILAAASGVSALRSAIFCFTIS